MTNSTPDINRRKQIIISGFADYGATIISVATGLISVPIGINYFGSVRYGIWLVIASVVAYLWISDFGVGLATLTLMAKAQDSIRQRAVLSRSFKLLLGLSVVFILIVIVINYLFPAWVGILGRIPSNFQKEAASALYAIVFLIIFQLPTTVFSAAFSGLQKVYWNRAYSAFHSISALCALAATVLVNGDLLTLAIFTGLGDLSVGIISGIHLFSTNPKIFPRLKDKAIEAPSTILLFNSGVRFFVLQIAVFIIWNTDNLIISHFLGPERVIPYAVTFKLFQMGLMVVTGSIIALWPMYGRASDRGEWDWIQQTYNNSAILQVIGGGLIFVGGIIYSQSIINLWAGPAAYGGLAVVVALGGYVYISSFGGSNTSLINGLNPTNIVVMIGIVEAVLNLIISISLVLIFGIAGVALGTFIAGFATNTWFGPLYIRHKTQKKVALDLRPIFLHTLIVILCVIMAIITVLFSPTELIRIAAGIVVLCVYLFLSWLVISQNLKNLIKNMVFRTIRY